MPFKTINLDLIDPNPKQARKYFDRQKLEGLAESLKERGLLNPILVRPLGDRYQLVHGERRWRAAKIAGWEIITAQIKAMSDEEAFLASLIENLNREDLTPLEEAQSYQDLIDQGYTQAGVAEVVKKSRSRVAQVLRILNLPEWLFWFFTTDGIFPPLTESHARELLRFRDIMDNLVTADNPDCHCVHRPRNPDGSWSPAHEPRWGNCLLYQAADRAWCRKLGRSEFRDLIDDVLYDEALYPIITAWRHNEPTKQEEAQAALACENRLILLVKEEGGDALQQLLGNTPESIRDKALNILLLTGARRELYPLEGHMDKDKYKPEVKELLELLHKAQEGTPALRAGAMWHKIHKYGLPDAEDVPIDKLGLGFRISAKYNPPEERYPGNT